MLKRFILLSVLTATQAFAQQNTDISGAEYSSGKGDAKLAGLGRQAVGEGKRLVITAPPEWHKDIAAKVRAGGHAEIVLRDGFYENVLVRVEDKPAPTKPEPEKPAVRVTPKTAVAAPARAPVSISREVAPTPAAAKNAQVSVPATSPIAAPQPMAPIASNVAPAAHPVSNASVPVAAPVADTGTIRKRFEQSLNDGRPAQGELAVASLQSGDVVYVDGTVRAVTRREGLKSVLYWLTGDLDVRRTELKVLAANRYQVLSVIRGSGSLRREFAVSAPTLDASEPSEESPVRLALEHKFNDGRHIGERLTTDKLRSGDIVYSSGGSAVVVRREGNDLHRYWLGGSLDLHQEAVQADGRDKYRILGDTVR